MAGWKTIKGFNIESLSSDPSNLSEGQVWYNTTSNTLKGYGNMTGAWATGTAMPMARGLALTIGISTAGMVVEGDNPTGPGGYTDQTTEWDGSSWTEGGDVNRIIGSMQLGFGTVTAGVLACGYQQAPTITFTTFVEEYDGSSWTEVNNSTNGYQDGTAAGTLTAGLLFGGNSPGGTGTNVEAYDGTNWTAGGALGTGRGRPQGSECGTQTAALCIGGSSYLTTVEQYDGSSWTGAPSMSQGKYNGGSSGIITAALAFGGHPVIATTESYNGSSWSTENILSTGRGYANGFGTGGASKYCGGNPGPGYANTVEDWVSGVTTVTFSNS